ncbi:MAG TPA: ATP synthase subunit I [Acidobacteriaceae bacterium]|nr:ATP synthase subunit I [Acidobacteriaceae bacterium]
MTDEPDPVPNTTPEMTDADLQGVLRRALRLVIVLTLLLVIAFTATMGWQSGLLALVGGAISWTGIREWSSLSTLVFARMDTQRPPRPMGRTLVMFFLRLGLVAAVLYVSLRCLNGTVYALIAGIGLAVVALSFESLRLLRG